MPVIQPDGISVALTPAVAGLSKIADPNAFSMVNLLCELLLMKDMTVYSFLLRVVFRTISITFVLRSRIF